VKFIKESTEEFRKVTWPTRNQAITLSIIVIVFTAVSTLVFLGSDKLFRAGYDALLESSTKVENQAPVELDASTDLNIQTEGGELDVVEVPLDEETQ
jgi:preprotein translocase SecE subunit